MKKNFTIMIFIIGLIFAGAALPYINSSFFIKTENEKQIKGQSATLQNNSLPNLPFVISGDNLTFALVKQSEAEWTVGKDYIYYYDVHLKNNTVGKLTITNRVFVNEDGILFAKLTNVSNQSYNVSLNIPQEEGNRYTWVNFDDKKQISMKHDPTIGIDKTTIPAGYLQPYKNDAYNKSFYIGKSYISAVKEKQYENNLISKIRVLIEEQNNITFDEGDHTSSFTINLETQGNDIAETWFMWSEEQLFTKSENLETWLNQYEDHIPITHKWLTPAGNYVKIPWSIEPFDKMGYARNIGRQFRDVFIREYMTKNERFFQNMAFNSITMIEALKKEQGSDLWTTEYTSTWLKKPYGIHAPYVDTRHNENLGYFLLEASQRLKLPELMKHFVAYADYLLAQVEKENIIPVTQDSYVISDYDGPGLKKKTHASLNHSLGEISYLLKAYLETNNEKYLEVAYSIRLAIETIGDEWIRTEGERKGDLWYQVNTDLTFAGNDYRYLTLEDLTINQELWKKTKYGKSELFQKLIDSKKAYIKGE